MNTPREAASTPTPDEAVPSLPDARRREALRRLGRGAAYALPATLALMSVNRAAAVS